ncbi:MAG: retropepsin-like aspartic protease [Gammaproteobacteria bacterium]
MPRLQCLTIKAHHGLARSIVTRCGISAGFDLNANPAPKIAPDCEFDAVWDTGAMACVISQQVVDACKLKPIGMTQVRGVHGVKTAEIYLVSVYLPSHVCCVNVKVTKGDLGDGPQILIGMDIISRGDFAITTEHGKTVMSFRMPSVKCIDFVEEARAADAEVKRQIPVPARGSENKERKKKQKQFGKNKRTKKRK